jgi:hypothetical protein
VALIDPINFNVLDSPILEQTEFGPDMKNWLSNSVDILNSNITTIGNINNNILIVNTANVGGAITSIVPLLGLTPSGFVEARIISTTNPGVTIDSIVPMLNQFQITFSANPGASAIISYIGFSTNPQG